MPNLTDSIDLGPNPSPYAAQSGEIFSAVTGDGANGLTLDGGLHSGVFFLLFTLGLTLWFIQGGLGQRH